MELLLVEDEPQVAKLLRSRFEKQAWCVDWAASVSLALSALERRRYDVVLLDLVLRPPGARAENGLEVVRVMRIRGIDTPVVVATGYATPDRGFEAGSLNVRAFLQKGGDPREMIDVCRQAAADRPDVLFQARQQLSTVDVLAAGARSRLTAILLRTVASPVLSLRHRQRVSQHVLALSTGAPLWQGVESLEALVEKPAPSPGHVDEILAVMSAVFISSGKALGAACGCAPRLISRALTDATGDGISVWLRFARVARFTAELVGTSEPVKQCAHRAGYEHSRQGVRDCRVVLGLAPTEIRHVVHSA